MTLSYAAGRAWPLVLLSNGLPVWRLTVCTYFSVRTPAVLRGSRHEQERRDRVQRVDGGRHHCHRGGAAGTRIHTHAHTRKHTRTHTKNHTRRQVHKRTTSARLANTRTITHAHSYAHAHTVRSCAHTLTRTFTHVHVQTRTHKCWYAAWHCFSETFLLFSTPCFPPS